MTYNELIAEFMGAEIITEPVYITSFDAAPAFINIYHKLDGVVYSGSELKYQTSWDWLMPVVQKISSMYDPNYEEGKYYHVDFAFGLFNLSLGQPISEVYEQVVKAIKWYNQQKN